MFERSCHLGCQRVWRLGAPSRCLLFTSTQQVSRSTASPRTVTISGKTKSFTHIRYFTVKLKGRISKRSIASRSHFPAVQTERKEDLGRVLSELSANAACCAARPVKGLCRPQYQVESMAC